MNANQTDSPRLSPLVPGLPEVLRRLWDEMGTDFENPYNRALGHNNQGAYFLTAKRVNADDHRMLFYMDARENGLLRVVQGLGWDRCALGLSRRAPELQWSHRHPRIIREDMARLVTFPTGLELYLVDVPRPGRVSADALLYDFSILEQHYYAGQHFVESKPFDPSSDRFAPLIPYLVTFGANSDATWTLSPREQTEGTDDE